MLKYLQRKNQALVNGITVPPYLDFRAPEMGWAYDGSAIQSMCASRHARRMIRNWAAVAIPQSFLRVVAAACAAVVLRTSKRPMLVEPVHHGKSGQATAKYRTRKERNDQSPHRGLQGG